ncbi:MAG: EamA family transporter [Nitrospinae bacterium]|nr:EamA family transporter [Nitrospinota bacterium]
MLDAIHPNILALCCAALIAFARVSQRYAIPRMKMHTANLVMACVTTTLGWFFFWVEGSLDQMPYQGVFWFMAMGFFGSFLGRYINFVAIRFTGLARAAVMSQTVLVWSSVLAVFILGESMSLQKAGGILGVMCGASLLVYNPKGDSGRRIPIHYYAIPIASALMYAFAHLVGKFAFEWISSSAFGMAVANTTSLTLLLGLAPFAHSQSDPRASGDNKGLFVLLLGAVLQGFGIFFFWSSVKLGEITRVIPLTRLSVLLIIFLSWLLFRQQENVTWRVILGALIALAGAFFTVTGR